MDKNKKQLVISVLVILGVAAASILFFQAFYEHVEEPIWRDWVLVGIGISIIGIVASLSILLQGFKIFFLSWLLATAIFPIFFGINWQYFGALALFLIFLLLGYRFHLKQGGNRIKIHLPEILHHSLPIVLLGLCFVIAITYYFSPAFGDLKLKITVPRPLFDFIWKIMSPGSFIKGDDKLLIPDSKLKETIPELPELPEESKIKEMAYEKINQTINSLLEQKLGGYAEQYFSLFVVFGVFLGLWTLSTAVIKWPIILVVIIVIGILRALGIAKIEKAQVEKESLIL